MLHMAHLSLYLDCLAGHYEGWATTRQGAHTTQLGWVGSFFFVVAIVCLATAPVLGLVSRVFIYLGLAHIVNGPHSQFSMLIQRAWHRFRDYCTVRVGR